ncbi:MAG: glycosyltransferase, partial [Acidobacteria bacterium]|nr:glycosyltransferase [Acidobacteriota bacterium]
LQNQFEIDIYTDTEKVSKEITDIFKIKKVSAFKPGTEKDYRHVIYQIGSNKIHASSYLTALLNPGILFLHEFVLHHLVKFITIGQGKKEAYTSEMEKYYGHEGAEMARLVHTGRAASETMYFHFPLFQRAVERSLAVITTTEEIKRNIRKAFPDKQVYIVPLVDGESTLPEKSEARAELGLKDEFIVAQFGIVSESKGVDDLLRMMQQVKNPKIRLALVGRVHDDYPLKDKLKEYEIEDCVISTGFLSRKDFEKWLAAVDLCVNLRYPTGGESSGALIEMMSASKAVIIPEYAQFLEMPEYVAIPLPMGRDRNELLRKFIEHYAEHPEPLEDIGKKARQYIKDNHSPKISCLKLLESLKEIEKRGYDDLVPMSAEETAMFQRLLKKTTVQGRKR